MKNKKEMFIISVILTFLFVVTLKVSVNPYIGGDEKKEFEKTGTVLEKNEVEKQQKVQNNQVNESIIESNAVNIKKYNETVLKNDLAVEDNKKRSYDSFSSSFFSYDGEIQFVDEATYKIIKSAYDKINFFGEFQTGDTNTYDLYKKKYIKLIKGEVDFYDRVTGEKLTFGDLLYAINYEESQFMLFDMSGDGNPELCITDGARYNYIFKYSPNSDRFILWADLGSTWYGLIGTQKVFWTRFQENNIFYLLDKNGNPDCTVFFHQKAIKNDKSQQQKYAYMVSMPEYADKPVEYTEEMKSQRYFDEYHKKYFFRVSKEQYHQLVENYFKSIDLAQKQIQTLAYTYDEFLYK